MLPPSPTPVARASLSLPGQLAHGLALVLTCCTSTRMCLKSTKATSLVPARFKGAETARAQNTDGRPKHQKDKTRVLHQPVQRSPLPRKGLDAYTQGAGCLHARGGAQVQRAAVAGAATRRKSKASTRHPEGPPDPQNIRLVLSHFWLAATMQQYAAIVPRRHLPPPPAARGHRAYRCTHAEERNGSGTAAIRVPIVITIHAGLS